MSERERTGKGRAGVPAKAAPKAAPTSAAPAPGEPSLKELMAPWKERTKLGGSTNGFVNCLAANEALRSRWAPRGEDERSKEISEAAALHRLMGVAPADALEGMLAVQMVATHNAALECFRRAHLPEQDFHAREASLNHATKLVRSFAALAEALNRHRGKGQQTVRVEHVTVQAGGQAIVGAITPGGGGGASDGERSHAKRIAHAPEPAMRGEDPQGEPVPVAGGAGQAALPDARRVRRRAGGQHERAQARALEP